VRRRQILLDEQSDRILKSLATHHEGNRSLAIREILKGHDRMEALLRNLVAVVEDQADLLIAEQRVRERPMKTLDQYLPDRSPSVSRTRAR